MICLNYSEYWINIIDGPVWVNLLMGDYRVGNIDDDEQLFLEEVHLAIARTGKFEFIKQFHSKILLN